jgi:hypothetical protein
VWVRCAVSIVFAALGTGNRVWSWGGSWELGRASHHSLTVPEALAADRAVAIVLRVRAREAVGPAGAGVIGSHRARSGRAACPNIARSRSRRGPRLDSRAAAGDELSYCQSRKQNGCEDVEGSAPFHDGYDCNARARPEQRMQAAKRLDFSVLNEGALAQVGTAPDTGGRQLSDSACVVHVPQTVQWVTRQVEPDC